MNLRKAETTAYALLNKFDISKPAIPVEDIAEKLEIRVVYESLDETLSGFLYRDKDNKENLICVNEKHTENRKRFTIAHELGHYLLHNGDNTHIDRNFIINFRDSVSSQAINVEEIEANAFAAALLMPEQLLIPTVLEKIKNGIDLVESTKEISLIAKKFGVSPQALCIRLGKLGYL
jgi:Zn-dependent peptidase ImmA (M78 family)